MTLEPLKEVYRDYEIGPREVGSRRLSSSALAALIADLKKVHGVFIREVKFWRFGHKDVLRFPPDQAHEAIERYDIMRMVTTGVLEAAPGELSFEIDLPSGLSTFWGSDCLFRVSGTRNKVDQVIPTITDHISRWPRTVDSIFHHNVFWFVVGVLSGAVFIWNLASSFSGSWTQSRTIILVLASYFVVLTNATSAAGFLSPFIWFYRPGGLMEARRKILPRLAFGGLGAVLLGLLANFLWYVLSP